MDQATHGSDKAWTRYCMGQITHWSDNAWTGPYNMWIT